VNVQVEMTLNLSPVEVISNYKSQIRYTTNTIGQVILEPWLIEYRLTLLLNIFGLEIQRINLHGIFHMIGIPVSGGLRLGLLARIVRTR
jgi:hypothetical protein